MTITDDPVTYSQHLQVTHARTATEGGWGAVETVEAVVELDSSSDNDMSPSISEVGPSNLQESRWEANVQQKSNYPYTNVVSPEAYIVDEEYFYCTIYTQSLQETRCTK